MPFFLLSRKGPSAGYAGSDASGGTSSAVRRSAQEPTEEISQNQRGSAGILFVQGEDDVKSGRVRGRVWCRGRDSGRGSGRNSSPTIDAPSRAS